MASTSASEATLTPALLVPLRPPAGHCSLECVEEDIESTFPVQVADEGFLLKGPASGQAAVVSPTRSRTPGRGPLRPAAESAYQQQHLSPFSGAAAMTDSCTESLATFVSQLGDDSASSVVYDAGNSMTTAPLRPLTFTRGSEPMTALERSPVGDALHQRATAPGGGQSVDVAGTTWPGLSVLTTQHQAPPSRLFRSASAVELYGVPERKVRGGRNTGCSTSQLSDKKMHGGLCFSRGDMPSVSSPTSLGASTSSTLPIPGLKVNTVKSVSIFCGSSGQLSDTTMDVRLADTASSTSRSGMMTGSMDDGHKVHGGVRGSGTERRVHAGLSRGSSRSSNLDHASMAGTPSIGIELLSSARSSMNNSLGMTGGLLATGSYGNTATMLADAGTSDAPTFARSSMVRFGSGDGDVSAVGGMRLYDALWSGLPLVREAQSPAEEKHIDTSPSQPNSKSSAAHHSQPALVDGLQSVESLLTTDALPSVKAAPAATGGPSASSPSAADLSRAGAGDGSVSFTSTVTVSAVSDALTMTGLITGDGSACCTESSPSMLMSSSAALHVSRSPSLSGRSLSESCGAPQVCPVARTESLGFMYKVHRVSTSQLQSADSLSTPLSARVASITGPSSGTLGLQGSSGGIFGSSMDLQGVRAFAGALTVKQDSLVKGRLSADSNSPRAPSPAPYGSLLHIGGSGACETVRDGYTRRPSLLEYAETAAAHAMQGSPLSRNGHAPRCSNTHGKHA